VRATSAMVAAAVGVDEEAIVRVTNLKRDWKGASLVLETDIVDMMLAAACVRIMSSLAFSKDRDDFDTS
jgi:hypothetical protein